MSLYDILFARSLSGDSGGGSSDFSTAEVTINFTFNEIYDDPITNVNYYLALGLTNDSITTIPIGQMADIPIGATSATAGIIEMPLYKNKLILNLSYCGFGNDNVQYYVDSGGVITATGNATINDNIATITGSCTLTIPVATMY